MVKLVYTHDSGSCEATRTGSSPVFGSMLQKKDKLKNRRTIISNAKYTGPGSVPVMNERIRSQEVRLIDDEGTNHGIISTSDALTMATEKDLDLVLISPEQDPPVAKILDYGKHKFESEKRAKDAKKKQHTVELKEVKMRYKIDTHDYDVKIKNIKRFLAAGNKVKIMVMLKGREIQHAHLAFGLVDRIIEALSEENYVTEKRASMEGRNAVMIIGPVGHS